MSSVQDISPSGDISDTNELPTLLSNEEVHELKTNNESVSSTPTEITNIKGKNANKNRNRKRRSKRVAETTVNQNQSRFPEASTSSAPDQDFVQNDGTCPIIPDQNPMYLENLIDHTELQLQPNIVHQIKQAFSKYLNVVTDPHRFRPYMSAEDVEKGLINNVLLESVLKINPIQFKNAYISTKDQDNEDILIVGLKNRNRALEGDIVVVLLDDELKQEQIEEGYDEQEEDELDQEGEAKTVKKKKKEQKRGQVVFIKKKIHTRTSTGHLKLKTYDGNLTALFVPTDHRFPRLEIGRTRPEIFFENEKEYENTLFLAEITSWYDTRFAYGEILSNIGQSGNMQTETVALLVENNLDTTSYGPEVRHLFPSSDYTIPEEEIKKREDCRNLCIITIDPANCCDIDDAVSCKELINGNYEIGIHISDVAHYLKENTELDEKVAQKATSIYLTNKTYHMLPEELCKLCSLLPGVDKLVFSVFWEFTKEGEVVSHRFAKAIIKSCSQLAYKHAQGILDEKEYFDRFPKTYNNFKFEDIRKSIKIIGGISAILRRNRFDNGALDIDQPKIKFNLNDDGLPDTFFFKQGKASHQMIQEFMILTNMTVAQRIYEDHPELALLRCHRPPNGFMLKNLATDLLPMGIELDVSSIGALHRSLIQYRDPATCNPAKNLVLNSLSIKAMNRANYICSASCDNKDLFHYALNAPVYTHFTSPIRRYADIMVHRLLAASLKLRDDPLWEVDKVRSIAAQCTKQKNNAKIAYEMSFELYMHKYIEMNSPYRTKAVVVEVRNGYIETTLMYMDLKQRINLKKDFPGKFKFISHESGNTKMSKMELTWKAQDDLPEVKQVIELFSILKVYLHKDENSKVKAKLIRPL